MTTRRTPEETQRAVSAIRTLLASGYELFPLQIGAKEPRDKGFLLRDYSGLDWRRWLNQGGNVGVRCRPVDLIMDVDPRHGGADSLEMLKWDVDDDFARYPVCHTGGGGQHYYMRIPEGHRWRWKLRGYPGIEFQAFGRYVVAPGSIHPDTGRMYRMEGPLIAFAEECKHEAPTGLLDLLRKPPRPPKTGNGGLFTTSQLAELLAVLDPADFGQGGDFHDEWLEIAMACHEATHGEGYDEWLDWCARDSRYGDDARAANLNRWDSFDSNLPDGVTYKTLLRAVARAGHKALVRRIEGVGVDFEEDDLDLSYVTGDEGAADGY